MAAAGDATLLLLAGAALVFGASVWRSRRTQEARLQELEGRMSPPPPPPNYRPVALWSLLPPAELRQPTLQGHTLPGGLMAWTLPALAEDVVAELVLVREAPCAYLGPAPDTVARKVAERGRDAGVDPRGRLLIPASMGDPAQALEQLLDHQAIPPPWIVAEAGADLARIIRIHQRFGCPVLLLTPDPPEAFLRLPTQGTPAS